MTIPRIASSLPDLTKIASSTVDAGKLTSATSDLTKLASSSQDLTKTIDAATTSAKIANTTTDLRKVTKTTTQTTTAAKDVALKSEDATRGLVTAKKLDDVPGSTKVSQELASGVTPTLKMTSDEAAATAKELNSLKKSKNPTVFLLDLKSMPRNRRIATGVGIALVAGLAIHAQAQTDRINKTVYKIISIKADPADKDFCLLSYEPADKFANQDIATISGTNSVPSIDGSHAITKPSEGLLRVRGSIRQPGTVGEFRIATNFARQLGRSSAEMTLAGVLPTLDALQAATGEVSNRTPSLFSNLFKNPWNTGVSFLILCFLVWISFSSVIPMFF